MKVKSIEFRKTQKSNRIARGKFQKEDNKKKETQYRGKSDQHRVCQKKKDKGLQKRGKNETFKQKCKQKR